MIFELTRYEWLMIYRNRKIRFSLLALMLLVMITGVSSAINSIHTNQEKQGVALIERERWLQQDEKDPHSAAHYSIYAFKLSPALEVLDTGINPFVGQAVWLEAHVQNDMLYRPQGDSTLLEKAGTVNPAIILIEIIPLFICWLVFAVMGQQKERGTLRFLISSATSQSTLIAAKWLAIWLLITGLLVLPIMIIGIVNALQLKGFTLDILARSLLWAGLMGSYFAILITIAMAIILLIESSRTALIFLISLWVVFVLVIPRWSSSFIDISAPLPTTQSIKDRLQQEAPIYWTAEEGKEHRKKILAEYGVTRIEDLPINYRGAELDLAERHSHEVYDRVLGDFYQQVTNQDKQFSYFSMLSPTVAAQQLSRAIAGSDFSHHYEFIIAAEHYRRALVNRMNAEVKNHVLNDAEKYTAGASLWSQIPEFSYVPPTLGSQLKTILFPFSILLGWLFAIVIVLNIAIRKSLS